MPVFYLRPRRLSCSSSPLAFSVLFTPKTMRVDYFHTGDHGREIVALDRIVSDGPWAGSTTRLLDDLNLGSYFFEVVDPDIEPRDLLARLRVALTASGSKPREAEDRRAHVPRVAPLPLAEGAGAGRPEEARRRRDVPRDLDDARRSRLARPANAADVAPRGKVWTVFENGPPTEKVDLLILGEGLHGSRASEVSRGREAPDRQALRHRAVPLAQEGLQRARDRPARGGVRGEPPARREVPPHRRCRRRTTSSSPSVTC